MVDTAKSTPQHPKHGQIIEREVQRYVVASVSPNCVIKLHT